MAWSYLCFRKTGTSVENGFYHVALSLNLAHTLACPTYSFCGSEEPSSMPLSQLVSSNKMNDQAEFEAF